MGGNLKNTNCHCLWVANWLKTFSFWGYPPLNSSKRWRFHPGSTNCAWEPIYRATAPNLLADCIYLRKMVCPFENQPAELIFLVDVRRAGLGSPAGLCLSSRADFNLFPQLHSWASQSQTDRLRPPPLLTPKVQQWQITVIQHQPQASLWCCSNFAKIWNDLTENIAARNVDAVI